MATTITLSSAYYFLNDTGGVSSILGYDGSRRMVRFSFTTPAEGADTYSFVINYAYLYGGSASVSLSFYVGTESDKPITNKIYSKA